MAECRLLREDRGKALQERARNDEGAGAAVAQHEVVISRGQKRVDRNRNDAGLDRAQEHGRKINRIEQAQQDLLLGFDPKMAKGIGGAIDAFGELLVSVCAGIIDKSGLVATPGSKVAINEIDRRVVVARNGDVGRLKGRPFNGHNFLPSRDILSKLCRSRRHDLIRCWMGRRQRSSIMIHIDSSADLYCTSIQGSLACMASGAFPYRNNRSLSFYKRYDSASHENKRIQRWQHGQRARPPPSCGRGATTAPCQLTISGSWVSGFAKRDRAVA